MHGKRYEENKHTELAALADAVMAYAEERVRMSPPLDQPMSEPDLDRLVGQTITAAGFGGVAETLELRILGSEGIGGVHRSHVDGGRRDGLDAWDAAQRLQGRRRLGSGLVK